MKQLKTFFKTALGLNVASLGHLAAGRFGLFSKSCRSALSAARFPGSTTDVGLPTVSLEDVLGDRKPQVMLQVKSLEEGVLPSDQSLVLAAILAVERPAAVLEVGTFVGSTTRMMAENAPQAVIHTVDLPLDFSPEEPSRVGIPKDDFQLISRRVVGRDFAGQQCAARIVQHFGDTAEWDFDAAKPADFFFIDGSHTYEYCRNDSEKCFALCSGEGVFLWHDCDDNHPGVTRLLCEWRRMGRDVRRIAGTPIAYWKNHQKPAACWPPVTGPSA